VADLLPPDAPLQIQAEGVLRYLPFGLLHDGQGWLLTRHTLAMDAGPAPAGARRDSGRPVAPHRGWALLGSARAAGLPALPEVPTELQTLARLAPRVPTPELRLDGQFTVPRCARPWRSAAWCTSPATSGWCRAMPRPPGCSWAAGSGSRWPSWRGRASTSTAWTC
jgi:hypothetical protein